MDEPKKVSEPTESEKQSGFECFICLQRRFVAFRPPCSHEICGVCVKKTFETETLSDRCGMCRANLPNKRNEYERSFHNVDDLKREEYEVAVNAAATDGNLPILKQMLAENHFVVSERVRVVGLQNRKDLNGSEGVITELLVTSDRHAVRLADGKQYKIKLENLRHSALESECIGIVALEGHTEIVRYLAEQKKADVNRTANDGATPILVAAQNGHTEIVKYLAEQTEADVNRASNDGFTPILVASQNGHTEIVKYLAEQIEADVNRAMNGGATLVYVAAQNGHIEIVKYLAEQTKADVNRAASSGATPVFIAAQEGHIEIVKYLAEKTEADVNRPANDGATPLLIAAQNGHIEIVKHLSEQTEVDVNRARNNGVTPVFIAAGQGHTEIARFLAEQTKADVNRAENDGVTPIMIAVAQGHADVVKLLIDSNANVAESLLPFATTSEIKNIIAEALEKK